MYINTLPGEFPYIRGTKIRNNTWYVRQNIEVTDYREANLKALTILMKGVDSLGFRIADPESVSKKNFEILLKDIHIEIVEISFLCNGKAKEILKHLTNISDDRGIDKANIRGAIEADPIGRLIVNGKLCVPVESGFDYLASLTTSASVFPNLRTIHLNASLFNNSGSETVEELALGISVGNDYLAKLTDRGLSSSLAA